LRRALVLGIALAASTAACAQDRGAALFAEHCAVCHEKKGEGIPGFAPRLAGNLADRAKTETGRAYLAQLTVSGMMGPIVSGGERFNDAMPSFAALSDEQIVAVAGYVLGELNGVPAEQRITPQDVAAARKRALPPNEVRRMRDR
jgi:mono/diheme cytochrome c family protein